MQNCQIVIVLRSKSIINVCKLLQLLGDCLKTPYWGLLLDPSGGLLSPMAKFSNFDRTIAVMGLNFMTHTTVTAGMGTAFTVVPRER